MKTHDELNALAISAKNNRADAERLYAEISGTVFYLARRYSIDDEEDALQDAFMAVHSAIESFDLNKGSFYTYCRRCVANRLLDRVRSANRKKNKGGLVSLNVRAEDSGDELMDSIASSADSPDDELIKKEEIEELKRKIELRLTSTERNVLRAYLDGKSYRETAQSLNIDEKAVDNALSRVKKKLRD